MLGQDGVTALRLKDKIQESAMLKKDPEGTVKKMMNLSLVSCQRACPETPIQTIISSLYNPYGSPDRQLQSVAHMLLGHAVNLVGRVSWTVPRWWSRVLGSIPNVATLRFPQWKATMFGTPSFSSGGNFRNCHFIVGWAPNSIVVARKPHGGHISKKGRIKRKDKDN